jgi:D-alanyl-D-alanine carboxypeptidase (penicillin-binding protein 5/6)
MVFIVLFFAVDTADAVNVSSASAVLMDSKTGRVLYEKNADIQKPIASTSKIMTYILTMEAVETGKINLTDKVRVSKNAASTGGSSYKLKEGDVLSVNELLDSMMIISANDSAVVLAEYVEGSIGKFTSKMNSRANSLGLTSAYFVNPNGMPLQNKDQNKMSAKDLAILTRHALENYEDHLLKITRQKQFTGTYKTFTKKNTNQLLETTDFLDGLKTGYTDLAGYCLVSVTRDMDSDGNRFISIVLGGKTGKQRFTDAQNMMEFGLKNFHTQTLLKKGDFLGYVQAESAEFIPIEFISNSTVSVLCSKDLDLLNDMNILGDNKTFTKDILDRGEIKSILKLKDGRNMEITILARRGISVFIDQTPIIFEKLRPIVMEETTLIPLRKVSESLGAEIIWDSATNTITGRKDNKSFLLNVGSKSALLNGEAVELLAPPVILDGNTMVPARFIAESLGMEVDWEQDTKSVKIYTR